MNLSLKRILGVALVLLFCTTGTALAEKVWTKKATSLRSEPNDKSRRVARVQANRELNVIDKEGNWYRVKSGVKSGWIHRSRIRVPKTRIARTSPANNKQRRQRNRRADDKADEPSSDSATADGVGTDDGSTSKSPDDESRAVCREGSVWCDREGDAMRVVVVANRVEAFREPSSDQDISFLATQGQELVVIGFHQPDWMYVKTLDGKLGWILKKTVREKGNFVGVRSGKNRVPGGDGAGTEQTGVGGDGSGTNADAGSERANGSDADGRAIGTAGDNAEAGASGVGAGAGAQMQDGAGTGADSALVSGRNDGEPPPSLLPKGGPPRFSLKLGAGLGGAVIGRSYSADNMEQVNYDVSAFAGVTSVAGDVRIRVSGAWQAGIDGNFTMLAGVTGLDFDSSIEGARDIGNFVQHRTEFGGKFGYDNDQFSALVRVGGLIEIFYINDLLNDAAIPRERLISGAAGIDLGVRPTSKLTLGLRSDVLVLGALAQTGGREDGDFDSLGALAVIAELNASYELLKRVELQAAARFDRLSPSWTGASVREPGVNGASRTDQIIRFVVGAGTRF